VDAILEGCARILERDGYSALTTNRIAESAGVGIGTLYEFFPNREAIVLALAERRLERLAREVQDGLEQVRALDASSGLELLLRRIVRAVAADRGLYGALLGEARFLRERPETRRAIGVFFELGRRASERAGDRVALPDPPADAWLIGRMLAHGVLEIALHEGGALSRERLGRELVRLAFRMIHGRDPR
jgi:AcrR family transcriptional regulator